MISGNSDKLNELNKLAKHGGNVAMLARRLGVDASEIVDFSSNVNPYGPPESVLEAMHASLDRIGEYPEPHAESFVTAVSKNYGIPADNIVAGNGSIELLYLIARVVGLEPGRYITPLCGREHEEIRSKFLLSVPSFTEYELALQKALQQPLKLPGIVKPLDKETSKETNREANKEIGKAIEKGIKGTEEVSNNGECRAKQEFAKENEVKDKTGIDFIQALTADGAIDGLRKRARAIDDSGLAILGNPNNPCGYAFEKDELLSLVDEFKNMVWVVDEAFIDFTTNGYFCGEGTDKLRIEALQVAGNSLIHEVIHRKNLVVIRSLTKMYSLAGIRLGYMIAPLSIANRMRDAKYPWSVNAVAAAAGIAALKEDKFVEDSAVKLTVAAERLYAELSTIAGLTPFRPSANYLLVRIDSGIRAAQLQQHMLHNHIAIRDCSTYTGLDDRYFRVAVKTPAQNSSLVSVLDKAIKEL